jgi:hypothetical protein
LDQGQKIALDLGKGVVSVRRLSDNKIQLKFRTKEFEGEYFHYTGDLFFIYKTGHLMKLMCQKHEVVRGEWFRPRVALTQHLCPTFLAAVGHVINLSTKTGCEPS